MADDTDDNLQTTVATGTGVVATKYVTSRHFQLVIMADAAGNLVPVIDNAAFTDGTSALLPAGFIFDETPGTGLTENDAAAARVDSKRAIVQVLEDATTRGQRQNVSSLGAAETIPMPRGLSVTASAYTRPANTTAYTAGDAVSDNGTAGSVTAISFTFADQNDAPVRIDQLSVTSTDTGLAGKTLRFYLFNSDPTASSGVSGGDNAAWSQKKAGAIGVIEVTFRAFSDGSVGQGVPADVPFILAKPLSGGKTIYALIQTVDAFTPSANSTTITPTLLGQQLRP